VAETLEALKHRGYKLFIASNGLEDYVKQVPAYKGIAPLIDGFYSAGEYQTRSKVDLVRLLVQQHGLQSAWMVGDRSSDVEAGHKNGFPVVGCAYAGFGENSELADADMRITRFAELAQLLP
jgi:phosphoglycolate phosphatase-like HAD superfamily hydrolase